ncbi:MAG: hypothetical protein ABWY27_16910, partial [Telluria sp.]
MIRRFSAFALAASLLGVLCVLQLFALWRSPAAWSPAVIAVSVKPGESVTLGQHELAAPQADATHIGLRRDLAGRWFARNVSGARQLVLRRDGVDRRTGTIALVQGQQFRLGAALFSVDAADARSVSFSEGGRHWRYDGATLRRDGSAQPACPDARMSSRLAASWNRLAPHALTMARPLTFGGNLYCDNRLGIEYVGYGSALLSRVKGQLLLSNSNGAPLSMSSAAGAHDLAQREEPLDGVTALVAGRTRFATRMQGNLLELRPLSHVALFADARHVLPPHVQWEWRQREAWTLPGGAAWWIALALCCALGAAGALAWQRGHWPFVRDAGAAIRAASFATALLAIAGVAALILQRSATPPGIGWSILLAGAALWCCVLLPGRLTLVTAAGTLLLAVGLLAQLELGLGAMESSWLRHFQKTSALLAIGLGAATHLRLRMQQPRAIAPQTWFEWTLALLACAALLALAMQVLFGDETGVFDLQPVEF